MKHPMSSGAEGCEMGTRQAISRRRHAVGPRIGEGLPACALQCQMDGAGCTAASVRVLRRPRDSSAFGRP